MADAGPGVITLAAVRRALVGHQPQPAQAPGARPAAVSLVLVEGAEGAELLFIKRAERAGDPWSGQIAFPGGRRQASDAALVDTARRESKEEVGLDPGRLGSYVGSLDECEPGAKRLPSLVIAPFVRAVPE